MQIKYPKENKVIRISNKKPKENTQNNELKNQIERMRCQIDELETSSNEMRQNSSSSKIEQIESSITANNAAISGLSNRLATDEQSIINNSTAIGQTNNAVSQISSDLQTLSNNYTTTSNQVTVHTNQISNIIPQLNGAMYDIAMMSDQVDQNTEDIADLKANGTGGSGGNCNCASDIADLKQNYQDTLNRIVVLESKVADAETQYLENIYRQYDLYEREFDITKQNTLTTPSVLFFTESMLTSLDENQETVTHSVKVVNNIELQIIFASAGTYNYVIYDNDTAIHTNSIEVEQNEVNSTKTVNIKTTNFTNISNHNYYIVITGLNCSITLKKLKMLLISPNVIIFNKICNYDVDYNYYKNKYYISDCSSGTAKICEISPSDLSSTSDIVWTNTGIAAQNYKIYYIGLTNNTSTDLGKKYAIVTQKNNTVKIVDLDTNQDLYTFDEGTFKVEKVCTKRNYSQLYYTKVNGNNIESKYCLLYQDGTISFTNIKDSEFIVDLNTIRNNFNYLQDTGSWFGFSIINKTGKSRYYINQTTVKQEVFDHVERIRWYMHNSINSNNFEYDVYFKIKGKFYHTFVTNYNNVVTYSNMQEIGEYEDVFIGENGNRFIVINNQLQYVPVS